MIFLLSASGMFLLNELLSGMFLSNDLFMIYLFMIYLLGSKIHVPFTSMFYKFLNAEYKQGVTS